MSQVPNKPHLSQLLRVHGGELGLQHLARAFPALGRHFGQHVQRTLHHQVRQECIHIVVLLDQVHHALFGEYPLECFHIVCPLVSQALLQCADGAYKYRKHKAVSECLKFPAAPVAVEIVLGQHGHQHSG